jgi:hypothetical protein
MVNQKKYCQECDEEIHGRKDKQFCSDHCRATHYNNLHVQVSTFIRRINNVIKRNRGILIQLNPKGNATVHKMHLLDYGFRFDFHTNIYKTTSGTTCYFCYDQGYIELEDDFYSLITRRDLMTIDHKTHSAIKTKNQQQF